MAIWDNLFKQRKKTVKIVVVNKQETMTMPSVIYNYWLPMLLVRMAYASNLKLETKMVS